MFAFDFLNSKSYRRGKIELAFFHHGDAPSEEAFLFLTEWASRKSIPLAVAHIASTKPRGLSPEEHWRTERYKFLNSLPGLVVTGHHLDDAVETWVHSCLTGRPKIIPYQTRNVIRPFICTEKSKIEAWCALHKIPFHVDAANGDLRLTRNRIRHKLMPEVLQVNPGIRKVVKRMYYPFRG